MTRLSAVLVEPKTPGNIGAVARCLANFDGDELVLVRPRCSLTSRAHSRARRGSEYLDTVRIVDGLGELDDYHLLLGTTGVLGSPGNLRRDPVLAEDLSDVVPVADVDVGLVFGREDHGLHNDELERCDHTVHLRASNSYPVLNLSHAAAVVLYEAYCATRQRDNTQRMVPREQREALLDLFDDVIEHVNDGTVTNPDEIVVALRRVLARSNVNQVEFGGLFKVLRRAHDELDASR
jgi:tRNA/rRNA methyltransferase